LSAMTPRRLLPALALAAALAAAPALARPDRPAASAKITGKGVDGVKLGASYTSLRLAHKLAKATLGCELAGPQARSARLRAPLKGSVDLTQTRPRKVATIVVTGGAKARGVGVGGTFAQIKAAFPGTKLSHATDSTFGISVAHVKKSAGGPISFAVSTTTHKITQIGVPQLSFCE
jgi:hypothetical protein